MIGITKANAGSWIKANVDRVNFLVCVEQDTPVLPVLALLESFPQCRLKPRFEGAYSQRL